MPDGDTHMFEQISKMPRPIHWFSRTHTHRVWQMLSWRFLLYLWNLWCFLTLSPPPSAPPSMLFRLILSDIICESVIRLSEYFWFRHEILYRSFFTRSFLWTERQCVSSSIPKQNDALIGWTERCARKESPLYPARIWEKIKRNGNRETCIYGCVFASYYHFPLSLSPICAGENLFVCRRLI